MKHAEFAQWIQLQFNFPKTSDRTNIVKNLQCRFKTISMFQRSISLIRFGKTIAILEAYDVMPGEWNADIEDLISERRKKQGAIRAKIVLNREEE